MDFWGFWFQNNVNFFVPPFIVNILLLFPLHNPFFKNSYHNWRGGETSYDTTGLGTQNPDSKTRRDC